MFRPGVLASAEGYGRTDGCGTLRPGFGKTSMLIYARVNNRDYNGTEYGSHEEDDHRMLDDF
jgi:hypothetical protein